MMYVPDGLAAPTSEEWARSQQLTALVCQEIHQSQAARISFARFMALALYTPGLGYYSSGESSIFGPQGDFVTAPEISPLFSRCLVQYCQPILTAFAQQGSVILELGAGTGRMAADILLALEQQNCLPTHYWIVEVSEALRVRQQANLRQWVPHLVDRITHFTQLPTAPICGVILANEVIDALPVHAFLLRNGVTQERYVAWNGENFVWQAAEASTALLCQTLAHLQNHHLPNVDYYNSEINLKIYNLMKQLAQVLEQGYVVIIDYGYPRREYYHPQRAQGTLRCHYRQRLHNNPFILLGLQDITSHVDFTQLAEAAHQVDFKIEAFTSQAAFLLACGLLNMSELSYNEGLTLETNRQIHRLVSPGEMGELCKVMVLGRGNAIAQRLSLARWDRQGLL